VTHKTFNNWSQATSGVVVARQGSSWLGRGRRGSSCHEESSWLVVPLVRPRRGPDHAGVVVARQVTSVTNMVRRTDGHMRGWVDGKTESQRLMARMGVRVTVAEILYITAQRRSRDCRDSDFYSSV
jgi:hypothetical protein